MNAVYISPAQQLRNRAADIEREEADLAAFKGLLSCLQ
jgi:hypothetical protein